MNEDTCCSLIETMYSLTFYESLPMPSRSMNDRVNDLEIGVRIAEKILLENTFPEEFHQNPQFSNLHNIQDVRILKIKFKNKLEKDISIILRLGWLLKLINNWTGVSNTTLEELIDRTISLKTKCETQLSLHFELRNLPSNDVNIVQLLNKASEVLAGDRKDQCERMSEKFMDLKFQHHLCISCRTFPAIYFMNPCHHASFCEKCAATLSETDSVCERCYFCRERVTDLQPLRFILKNDI